MGQDIALDWDLVTPLFFFFPSGSLAYTICVVVFLHPANIRQLSFSFLLMAGLASLRLRLARPYQTHLDPVYGRYISSTRRPGDVSLGGGCSGVLQAAWRREVLRWSCCIGRRCLDKWIMKFNALIRSSICILCSGESSRVFGMNWLSRIGLFILDMSKNLRHAFLGLHSLLSTTSYYDIHSIIEGIPHILLGLIPCESDRTMRTLNSE